MHNADESCLFEHVFTHTTNRADPILGEIFESCSRGDSGIGISDGRIILITACTTNVLIHNQSSFAELEFKAKT